ncbi:MAG: OmpA family protein [Pyrinomonadaceae bacterium]|nr:OmpA family protein [Sphingobacteriaceae bacterium]
MILNLRSIIFLTLGMWCSTCGYAQLRISRVDVKKWVQQNFTGQGIVVGEIKFKGNPLAVGAFTNQNNVLQLKKGLVISTGLADYVAGPNNKYNQTYPFSDAERDADLQPLVKPGLYDVSVIEFDFVPLANSIQFNYQFGSEEYPEYVGSTYNDIFAFFVSDEKTKKNIALIPGKNIPVSINTVNHQSGTEYFLENNVFSSALINRGASLTTAKRKRGIFSSIRKGIKSVFSSQKAEEADLSSQYIDPALLKKVNPIMYKYLQFDGITKKLAAQMYVTPYSKYHLKIIIADVADNIYDSGVFLEDRSLFAQRDTMQPGFTEYPDLSKLVDLKQILAGKKLEDLLPDTVYLEEANIYFDFDKSDIPIPELKKLKSITSTYDRVKNKYTMRVAGHTDSIGNLSYNMALSRRRNQSVMHALQELRLIDSPIEITEDAFLKPAAKNDTDEGRTKNRRVQIFFVKKDN